MLELAGRGRIASIEPPVIPVSTDAYAQWARLAYLRIGVRGYMRSTYDRRGGNEAADASHFLYQTAENFNVTLDVEGRGVIYFVRTNRWHGSPWHYEVDGVDHLVGESSTADPTRPVKDSVFLPEKSFPLPLTANWSTTNGADLMWVPITFSKRFRLGYGRTFYGTGYYIYQVTRRRAHHPADVDPRAQPDPRADPLHAGSPPAVPRTLARRAGLERDALHGVQLRHAPQPAAVFAAAAALIAW